MIDKTDAHAIELAALTADVVSAFVSNNAVPVAGLPDLIASVHRSLSGLSQPVAPATEPPVPAVNPKKSVFPDHIFSLEDGRKFKSMKRHLGLLGLTPDQYRAKWGLPADYPMVAPNYAAARSALAKSIGLGRKAAPATPAKKAPAKRKAKA
ncbi:MucR family transcriptional regulator [Mesorhizobium sp. AR02]|uniref:MucR family transcriptional regulator n=1 Tax=Mesorhizobium sp. AR02 TaxID=2865837 RepID=UPI0021606EB8|nr:MucR family transcriptional regulator [Mesorhizobium sp. AR02]UVK54914.1 MucR family transcriptional regulator [Mesorhizobium sp. AR02]